MSVPPNQSPYIVNVTDFYDHLGLLHPLVTGLPSLVVAWLYLRFSSNATLSPTRLCTVTLGSTLSRIITQPDLNLARGLISLAVILCSEWVTSFMSSRISSAAYLFKSPPILLVFRGEIDHESLRKNRVAVSGVMQALRTSGYRNLDQIEALCLESAGGFSIIARLKDGETAESLAYVPQYVERLSQLVGCEIEAKGEHAPSTPRQPRSRKQSKMENDVEG